MSCCPRAIDLLADRFEVRRGGLDATQGQLLELAPGADALVTDLTVPVDDEVLDACGDGLRIVANFAVGYDNVDLEACRRREIAVTNTPDALTNATAELAVTLTLAAARRLTDAERTVREGRWTGWAPGDFRGIELSGATVGIVGLGRIGSRYGELLRGFSARLLYTSRSPKPEGDALGAERVELGDLLEAADVVSLHAPGSPETHHMIGSDELDLIGAGRRPRQHGPGNAGRHARADRRARGGQARRRRARRLRGGAGGSARSCSRRRG